jgi:hypothetical protein
MAKKISAVLLFLRTVPTPEWYENTSGIYTF